MLKRDYFWLARVGACSRRTLNTTDKVFMQLFIDYSEVILITAPKSIIQYLEVFQN